MPPPQAESAQADRDAARRRTLTDLVQQASRDAEPWAIRAAIDQVAQNRVTLHRLAFQVGAQPHLLRSAEPRSSMLVQCFIIALQESGVPGVARPRCAQCGRDDVMLDRPHPGGLRQCQRCYARSRREVCCGCGQSRPVNLRNDRGALCGTCASKDPSRWQACCDCGRLRPVNEHTAGGPLCLRCYKQRKAASPGRGTAAQRHVARIDLLLAVAREADAGVSRARVEGAAAKSAPGKNRLAMLATYVREHPNALVVGDNRAPLVVGQFIAALQSQGVAGLTRPACEGCRAPVDLPHNRPDGHRMCVRCYTQGHTAQCGTCGEDRPVVARDLQGRPSCSGCYTKSRSAQECCECGRVKPVADRRGPNRAPRCSGCRRRDRATWETCQGCGAFAPVAQRDPMSAKARCWRCYHPPQGQCDLCGQRNAIRSRRSGLVICVRCYRGRWEECARCSSLTWCYLRGAVVLCLRCRSMTN